MSTVPPVSLQNLYNDLDFLAGIKDKQKYSFNKRYYTNLDMMGWVWRKLDGENQEINGISTMESICTNAAQQWDTYKNKKPFGAMLLDKIVAARYGLDRVVKTYDSLQNTVYSSNIRNRGIIILDGVIPEERKIKEGFIPPPYHEDDDEEDHDSKQRRKSVVGSTPETKKLQSSFGRKSTESRVVSSSPPVNSNLDSILSLNGENSDNEDM